MDVDDWWLKVNSLQSSLQRLFGGFHQVRVERATDGQPLDSPDSEVLLRFFNEVQSLQNKRTITVLF